MIQHFKILKKVGLTKGSVVKLMSRLGIIWPFVNAFRKAVEEVKPEIRHDSKLTLLALNPDRFRSDLQILADSGEFRVLKIPMSWHAKPLDWFCPAEIRNLVSDQDFFSHTNERLQKARKELRAFLRQILPSLYARLKVDCVIGAAVHYRQDYDWGEVSHEIGVPYIVLHRENFATDPGHVKCFYNHCRNRKFRGTHIIVHNDVMKDIFIRAELARLENISVLGCLRMDDYVRSVGEAKPSNRKRKKVTLFSFIRTTGLFGLMKLFPEDWDQGLSQFLEHVHGAFAQLAIENNDVDFIIKSKNPGIWIDEIEYALQKQKVKWEQIQNLQITADADVQELIFTSDVICGFGSTVILEAAIAEKPVIVPHFDETLRPEYSDFIHLKDYYHLFDVAQSPEEFKSLIVENLRNPKIDEGRLSALKALFEKYVSSMNADATENYVNCIKKVIATRQGKLNIPL